MKIKIFNILNVLVALLLVLGFNMITPVPA